MLKEAPSATMAASGTPCAISQPRMASASRMGSSFPCAPQTISDVARPSRHAASAASQR